MMLGFLNLKEKVEEIGVKKMLQNLLIVVVVAVIVVIVSSTFFENKSDNRNSVKGEDIELNEELNFKTTYEEQLESRLKSILQQINGVGEVSIMITLKVGNEIVPATNIIETESQTDEKDSGGGTRAILQKSVDRKIVLRDNPGTEDQPLIVKEIMPEIKGVIVVAEGAGHPAIEAQITEAVQTVLGIPAFRVKVYSR